MSHMIIYEIPRGWKPVSPEVSLCDLYLHAVLQDSSGLLAQLPPEDSPAGSGDSHPRDTSTRGAQGHLGWCGLHIVRMGAGGLRTGRWGVPMG